MPIIQSNCPEQLSYSIKDAAKATSLGRTKIYSLIKAGTLKSIKVGQRTLISRRALEELLTIH